MTQQKLVVEEADRIISGNAACAWAARYARVNVISAYPITPQTTIVEKLSDFVEEGKLDSEYIRVESEHSVMASLIGAAYTGARTYSATSGQGLFYMHEMLHWAAGARLPIVMGIANRGVAPPWNIWADHQDVMAQRDTGWMIFFSSNHQEIFDTHLQLYKICENEDVFLPAFVCLGGFIMSHTQQAVHMPDQTLVDEFLPEVPEKGWPHFFLDPDRPITHGNLQSPGGPNVTPDAWYYEYRYLIQKAHEKAKQVIIDVAKEYKKKFGIFHGDLIEEYKCDDTEVALVSIGCIADQAKVAVDNLREQGYKVGAVKLRCYKPFPTEQFQKLANRIRIFPVMERSMAFGLTGGIASVDLKAVFYQHPKKPFVLPVIAGVGGRDVRVEDQMDVLKQAVEMVESNEIKTNLILSGMHK
ncbi:MAG: pyruvate ferredoxin oxidoreductase [Candidatus Helarchaeota archaeon]|nr:pyruvate ferredoxin oxidoreductase [Candidatus Helarchaeota archaeon]